MKRFENRCQALLRRELNTAGSTDEKRDICTTVLSFEAMAPRTRSDVPRVDPSREDEARIRAGVAELERGEGRTLTEEELRRLAETGEWPEWCGPSS
jgi:hypothetical protein